MSTLNVLGFLEVAHLYEQKINLALKYSGLRLPLYRTLLFMEKSGKITVSDLSRHFKITSASMSVLVREMIVADLVKKIKHQGDNRSYYIQLTKYGKNRIDFSKDEVERVIKNISLNTSSETIGLLNHFLQSVRANN